MKPKDKMFQVIYTLCKVADGEARSFSLEKGMQFHRGS